MLLCGAKWHDITSWGRDDSEEIRKTPRTYSARIGEFRLTVSRHIHLDPSDWMISCYPLFDSISVADAKPDSVLNAEQAQRLAFDLVGEKLRTAISDLDLLAKNSGYKK